MTEGVPRRCITRCGTLVMPPASRCPACEAVYQHTRRQTHPQQGWQWAAIAKAAKAACPQCQVCGSSADLECDHRIPQSLADGVNVYCRACHRLKTNADARGEAPPFALPPAVDYVISRAAPKQQTGRPARPQGAAKPAAVARAKPARPAKAARPARVLGKKR